MSESADIGVLDGYTRKTELGCGTLYLTVNLRDGKPYRVFLRVGKCGTCVRATLEAIGRLITIELQNGNNIERVAYTLRNLTCDNGLPGKPSCLDVVARELEKYCDG